MAVGQYDRKMDHDHQPQDSPSRDADKYIVRFPDGMRDRLKEAAKASGRSLNAEIVHRLQTSFEEAQPLQAQDGSPMTMQALNEAKRIGQERVRLRMLLADAKAEQMGLMAALSGDERSVAEERLEWRAQISRLSKAIAQFERELIQLEERQYLEARQD